MINVNSMKKMQKDDLFVMIIELGVIILINECFFGFF
jgi:hypothetical protein